MKVLYVDFKRQPAKPGIYHAGNPNSAAEAVNALVDGDLIVARETSGRAAQGSIRLAIARGVKVVVFSGFWTGMGDLSAAREVVTWLPKDGQWWAATEIAVYDDERVLVDWVRAGLNIDAAVQPLRQCIPESLRVAESYPELMSAIERMAERYPLVRKAMEESK